VGVFSSLSRPSKRVSEVVHYEWQNIRMDLYYIQVKFWILNFRNLQTVDMLEYFYFILIARNKEWGGINYILIVSHYACPMKYQSRENSDPEQRRCLAGLADWYVFSHIFRVANSQYLVLPACLSACLHVLPVSSYDECILTKPLLRPAWHHLLLSCTVQWTIQVYWKFMPLPTYLLGYYVG
jgi:hypothetical protein